MASIDISLFSGVAFKIRNSVEPVEEEEEEEEGATAEGTEEEEEEEQQQQQSSRPAPVLTYPPSVVRPPNPSPPAADFDAAALAGEPGEELRRHRPRRLQELLSECVGVYDCREEEEEEDDDDGKKQHLLPLPPARGATVSPGAASLAFSDAPPPEPQEPQPEPQPQPPIQRPRACSQQPSRGRSVNPEAERRWRAARERQWVAPKRLRPSGRVASETPNLWEEELPPPQPESSQAPSEVDVCNVVRRLYPSKAARQRRAKDIERLQEQHHHHHQLSQVRRAASSDVTRRLARPLERSCPEYPGHDAGKECTFRPQLTKHDLTERNNLGRLMGPVWERLTKDNKKAGFAGR